MKTIKNALVLILLIVAFVSAQSDNPADDVKKESSNKGTKQHYIEDVTIEGSIGAGTDMVNGYSFGFNTMAFMENNLRILFDDTSVDTFPGNDWQIEINESANGGLNHFRIKDITGGKDPFTIQAGAKSNAFVLSSDSRLGLGTSSPDTELHIVDGDTPTLRLDQDNSIGWGVQVWDVAANETNFFIRDQTNGSQLPFRIQPVAPTNSLTIIANGNVGIGTWNPSQKLHVTGGSALVDSTLFSNKIGVGTLTPSEKLHVAGNAQVDSILISNKIGVGTSEPDQELHVIGNAQVDGSFYFGNDETDGNWRVRVIDGKLTFEKRENSAWVKKIDFE